jgi:hypothetical protein
MTACSETITDIYDKVVDGLAQKFKEYEIDKYSVLFVDFLLRQPISDRCCFDNGLIKFGSGECNDESKLPLPPGQAERLLEEIAAMLEPIRERLNEAFERFNEESSEDRQIRGVEFMVSQAGQGIAEKLPCCFDQNLIYICARTRAEIEPRCFVEVNC